MEKRPKLSPPFWASLIFIVCLCVAFFIFPKQKAFTEANQITPPHVSPGVPLAYFFGVVAVLGIVLLLIPISKLKVVLRILFTFLFCWGLLIILGLSIPAFAALPISIAIGLLWFFQTRVWLQDLLLIFTLASVSSVFGYIFSPWTVMILLLVISVYDILAVRFGYMMWLTKKLSESDTLPAFVIPNSIADWNMNLREGGVSKLFTDEPTERQFSILGGGDIGFPIFLAASVFFAYGFIDSIIVAAFSLLGLIGAYWIQAAFLKGKPMPALPPISFSSLIGLLIVYFILLA